MWNACGTVEMPVGFWWGKPEGMRSFEEIRWRVGCRSNGSCCVTLQDGVLCIHLAQESGKLRAGVRTGTELGVSQIAVHFSDRR